MKFLLIPFFVFAFCVSLPVQAQERDSVSNGSGLPLPRFVSLDSDKVYVRAGPALRYPIKWVYKRKNLPVEIIQEYNSWRKIRDFESEEGWIHTSLLSGKRTVLIQSAAEEEKNLFPLREGFSVESRMIAQLERRVIADVNRCLDDWCRIEKDGYKGWIERNSLWGIYEDEELD